MATTKLNNLIIAVSRRVGDARTDASSAGDSGRRITSALWVEYVNQALKDLLMEKFEALGVDGFADAFPEFVKTSSALTLTGGSVAKPADAWVFVELLKSDGSIRFERVESSRVLQVKYGHDPLQVPSATEPAFYEEAGNVVALPSSVGTWTVVGRYVVTPEDLVVVTGAGGTDLSLNARWWGELKDRVAALAVKDMQLIGSPAAADTVTMP